MCRGVQAVRKTPWAAGRARVDPCTKRLALRLQPGEVAIICHADLDAATARMLVRRRPAAVVDALPLTTGQRPARGAAVLLQAAIPVLHDVGAGVLEAVAEGSWVQLRGSCLLDDRGRVVGCGKLLTAEQVELALRQAQQAFRSWLPGFTANTLERALREAYLVGMELTLPPLSTPLAGRAALVAAREAEVVDDLKALLPFRRRLQPVCIGVDGGADALREAGWPCHLIVGDMDSVTDQALVSGAELVVHAYPDGRAPGLARVRSLGLFAHVFPCPGTSEDAALLLAAEAGAQPVVLVGGHTSPDSVLEKGRPGMASTLLVRMRLGERLVDATGFSRWWGGARSGAEADGGWVAAAAMLPLAALGFLSEPLHLLLKLAWLGVQAGWYSGFGGL